MKVWNWHDGGWTKNFDALSELFEALDDLVDTTEEAAGFVTFTQDGTVHLVDEEETVVALFDGDMLLVPVSADGDWREWDDHRKNLQHAM
jgi:uncharacterized cupin superfamily protein